MVVRRPVPSCEPKHFVERYLAPMPPVEAEAVFVEVGLNMLAAEPVIDAKRPPLHQREEAVYPRQYDMGRHLADEVRVMAVTHRAEIVVTGVAVGQHDASLLDVRRDEGHQRRRRVVANDLKPDALGACVEEFSAWAPSRCYPCRSVYHLDGADDRDHALPTADIRGRVVLSVGDFGLVDFNDARQPRPLGIDHRLPELGFQQPRSPVVHAKQLSELDGGQAVGVRRHEIGSPKPRSQRQLRLRHNRARRRRSLSAACTAFPYGTAFQRPTLPDRATGWANETVRPARLDQMTDAGGLASVGVLELDHRLRKPHHGNHPLDACAARNLHLQGQGGPHQPDTST